MIWFIIGGGLMVAWGVARNPMLRLKVIQEGAWSRLIQGTAVDFGMGALVFGFPLWLVFGE